MWEALKAGFEAKYPQVSVALEEVLYNHYNEKVGAYVAAGGGPDVLVLETGDATFKFKDSLTNLKDSTAAILPTVVSPEMVCDGYDCANAVYGVPFSLQAHPIYYNKQVLTDAGVDMTTPPATLSDLDAACQKVKASGKECFAMGLKGYGGIVLWIALPNYTATADEKIGLATGKTKITDPSIGSATTIFAWMTARGWFPKNAASLTLSPDEDAAFETGKAAFYVGLLGDDLNWVPFDKKIGPGKWGAIPYPKLAAGTIPGVVPGPLNGKLDTLAATAITIPKWATNTDAAIAFVKYVTSAEAAVILLQHGVWPAAKQFDTSTVNSAGFKQLASLAADSSPYVFNFMSLRAQTDLEPQLQKLFSGQTTPDQFNAALEASNQQR